MRFSTQAWSENISVYKGIQNNEFYLRMREGRLALDDYGFYLYQDRYYLPFYARACAAVTSKIEFNHFDQLLDLSKSTLDELKSVYKKINEEFKPLPSAFVTEETKQYSSCLINTSVSMAPEVGLAALVPCCWYFYENFKYMAKSISDNNPYESIIQEYCNEDAYAQLKGLLELLDELAESCDGSTRTLMLQAFRKSALYELEFLRAVDRVSAGESNDTNPSSDQYVCNDVFHSPIAFSVHSRIRKS